MQHEKDVGACVWYDAMLHLPALVMSCKTSNLGRFGNPGLKRTLAAVCRCGNAAEFWKSAICTMHEAGLYHGKARHCGGKILALPEPCKAMLHSCYCLFCHHAA